MAESVCVNPEREPTADQRPAPASSPERFVSHARTFAGMTLASRVLGLARDALITRALGVGPVATAFNIAFQFPNTFRRLFGEGALSAAFIPEYARLVKDNPALADRFVSLAVGALTLGLGVLVVLIELALVALLAFAELPPDGRLAITYLAVMLPFMPLVCTTALLGGALQTHGKFAAQAGAPIILNLAMIAAAWFWGYQLKANAPRIALMVSAAVALAGVLQVAWCAWDLRGLVRWTRAFGGAHEPAKRMLARMGPIVVGLGTIQFATLIESWLLVGWPINIGPTIAGRAYPLDAAAGAVLYNAQRLYQFPLGVFGIALATAVFPLLARQTDDRAAFAHTLRRGIRLALFIGLPATAGLVLVARELTAVIYLGGRVTAADAARMSWALVMYSAVVGAYSLTHVLTRAFYAKGDTRYPTRISIITVVLGLALGAGLMWFMREGGLALAASLAAAAQLALLARRAHATLGDDRPLFDPAVTRAVARIALGTLVMSATVFGAKLALDAALGPAELWRHFALRLAVLTILGAAVYAALARQFCHEEMRWAMERGK
jgi:putative peptidoglycan lipid II flippase